MVSATAKMRTRSAGRRAKTSLSTTVTRPCKSLKAASTGLACGARRQQRRGELGSEARRVAGRGVPSTAQRSISASRPARSPAGPYTSRASAARRPARARCPCSRRPGRFDSVIEGEPVVAAPGRFAQLVAQAPQPVARGPHRRELAHRQQAAAARLAQPGHLVPRPLIQSAHWMSRRPPLPCFKCGSSSQTEPPNFLRRAWNSSSLSLMNSSTGFCSSSTTAARSSGL